MANKKYTVTASQKNTQVPVKAGKIKKPVPDFPNIHPVIGMLKMSKKESPGSKKQGVLSKMHGRAEKDFTKDIRDSDMSQTGPGDEMDIPTIGDDTKINYGLGEDKNNYAGDDHGE